MMTRFLDARIPVHFGLPTPIGRTTAVLVETGLPEVAGPTVVRFDHTESDATADTHPAGCACCAGRPPAFEALRRLFLARARGEVGFFVDVSIVARPATEARLRAALRDDPLLTGWFRAADPVPPVRGNANKAEEGPDAP